MPLVVTVQGVALPLADLGLTGNQANDANVKLLETAPAVPLAVEPGLVVAAACEPGFSAVFALRVDVEESVVELRASANSAGGTVFMTDIAWLDAATGVRLRVDTYHSLASRSSSRAPHADSEPHRDVNANASDSELGSTGAGPRSLSARGQRLRSASGTSGRPASAAAPEANGGLSTSPADGTSESSGPQGSSGSSLPPPTQPEAVTAPSGSSWSGGLAPPTLCARILTLQLGGVNPGSDSDVGLRSVLLLQSPTTGRVEEVVELDAAQGAGASVPPGPAPGVGMRSGWNGEL
jgi:hypothetical protein